MHTKINTHQNNSNFLTHDIWSKPKLGMQHIHLELLWNLMLGNSGKPVTLETSSLTKSLRHVFQEQETHDFRKPGTCESSNSRMCEVRESWFGEEIGSRTCESPEPQAGNGANFGGRPIRESVEDQVRGSRAKTRTNRWRSEGRFGNLSKTKFRSHVWRHSRTGEEAKSKLLSQKGRV
jgi:hypothetical protein